MVCWYVFNNLLTISQSGPECHVVIELGLNKESERPRYPFSNHPYFPVQAITPAGVVGKGKEYLQYFYQQPMTSEEVFSFSHINGMDKL